MDILEKVFLLALFKKESDETIDDVIHKLVNNGSMSMKEAKKVLKKLKEDLYVDENNSITFTGITQGQQVENEFKL